MQAARATPAVRAGYVRSKRQSGSRGAGVAVMRLYRGARSLFQRAPPQKYSPAEQPGSITLPRTMAEVVAIAVAAAGMRTVSVRTAVTGGEAHFSVWISADGRPCASIVSSRSTGDPHESPDWRTRIQESLDDRSVPVVTFLRKTRRRGRRGTTRVVSRQRHITSSGIEPP